MVPLGTYLYLSFAEHLSLFLKFVSIHTVQSRKLILPEKNVYAPRCPAPTHVFGSTQKVVQKQALVGQTCVYVPAPAHTAL